MNKYVEYALTRVKLKNELIPHSDDLQCLRACSVTRAVTGWYRFGGAAGGADAPTPPCCIPPPNVDGQEYGASLYMCWTFISGTVPIRTPSGVSRSNEGPEGEAINCRESAAVTLTCFIKVCLQRSVKKHSVFL